MESALREALDKAETQAIRCRKKLQAKKRQPKEEKIAAEPQLQRPRRASAKPSARGETSGRRLLPRPTAMGAADPSFP